MFTKSILSLVLIFSGSLVAYANGETKYVPDVKKLTATCASCHAKPNQNGSYDYSNPGLAGAPIIAGQYPDYLREALKSYLKNNRINFGRTNASMVASAKLLEGKTPAETEANIQAVAKYFSAMPSPLKSIK